jgi:hypothetical protein
MPRETIRLGLSTPFTPEPGARFLSFLAYPDSKNAMMRAEFCLAIYRFAVMAMCERDRGWANSLQAIKPAIVLMGDTNRRKALRLGSTQLRYRLNAVEFFAIPHLVAEFQECELGREPINLQGRSAGQLDRPCSRMEADADHRPNLGAELRRMVKISARGRRQDNAV